MTKYKVYLYEDTVLDHYTLEGNRVYAPTGKRRLVKTINVNSYREAKYKARQIAKKLGVSVRRIVLERVRNIKLAVNKNKQRR